MLTHEPINPSFPSLHPRDLVAALGVSMLALGACDPGDMDDLESEEEARLMAESEDLDADQEAAALVDPASAPQPLEDDEPVPAGPDLDLTSVPDVQAVGWKPWISDETPPSTCATGEIVQGVDCDGGWCDNVRINCSYYGGTLGDSWWSNWFSEEAPNNFYQCPINQYVTGVACKGSRCDNLAVECTATSYGHYDCFWTPGSYSEEGVPYLAPPGRAIAGIWCLQGWCDNKKYWVCDLGL